MIMLNVCSCFSDLIIINISSIRLLSIRLLPMFCALFVINLICIVICIHFLLYVVFFIALMFVMHSLVHILSLLGFALLLVFVLIIFIILNVEHSPSLPC